MTAQRSRPDPDGDGAGNFQHGWDTLVGPVSARVEPLTGGPEDYRDGQNASRQRFLIHLRANGATRQIDARDRIEQHGPKSRAFNVLSAVEEPGTVMVKLLCELTAVLSPPTEFVTEYETEGEPLFPVGP